MKEGDDLAIRDRVRKNQGSQGSSDEVANSDVNELQEDNEDALYDDEYTDYIEEEAESARDIMLRFKNNRKKRERFIRLKMWVNYLVSMMEKDRGKIPDNIGNKILITNNLYITSLFMSSIVQVTSLSLDTPVTLMQEIIKKLRDEESTAVIDFTIKNMPFDVDQKDSGLNSRISLWESSMDDDSITDRQKEIAARCLYTVEVAQSGAKMMKSRIFLTIRAKTGSELTKAEKIVYKYLSSIGASYKPITSNIKNVLKYISLISDYHDKSIKDIKAIVNSEQTLSQMLPNTNSFNGSKGIYCGINITNNTPFMLDLVNITIARNMYVIGPAGDGKTGLALNMVSSAVENGMAVCIQDIKGNEFTNFIKSTGGYIVSCRQMSPGFINSFKMIADESDDNSADLYFKANVAFSKEQLMILSGIQDREELNELEELLDEFLDSLYVSLGVLPGNRNTWQHTLHLDPFNVYDSFISYMSPTVQSKYRVVSKKVLSAFRMYLSPNGSKSYVFKQEFDYNAVLRAPTLMFDFGILEGATEQVDFVLFKLKFLYMRKLNAKYVAYKYSRGIKVLKILEEAQIAVNDPDIMRGYVEEYTLRRAQGQSTLLLGNSIEALADNHISKPLIENVKALFIGRLNPDAKETVIKKFGLEGKRELLDSLGSDKSHEHSFLFVNNMQPNALTPILKVQFEAGKKYKLLTPVAHDSKLIV